MLPFSSNDILSPGFILLKIKEDKHIVASFSLIIWADFGLFKDLLGRVWDKALEEEGPKKAGQYSMVTSSKIRIDASQTEEQGASGQTQILKGSPQGMEARAGSLGGI